MSLKEDIVKVENKMKVIEEESLAWELLKTSQETNKKTNKRMFIIWIITFIALISLSVYTIWLLNDIGTYEDTITQENTDGYNNYIGNDGDIFNGKTGD